MSAKSGKGGKSSSKGSGEAGNESKEVKRREVKELHVVVVDEGSARDSMNDAGQTDWSVFITDAVTRAGSKFEHFNVVIEQTVWKDMAISSYSESSCMITIRAATHKPINEKQ